jgi:hypothetical protein
VKLARSADRALRGENTMQSALMVSLAVSIVLGMWLIWKMTP